jgi:hypothetical protein
MTAISDKYNALGGSSGFLGAPTSGEILNADGVGYHQDFSGGTIYWHPDLGAYEVHGVIRARWVALGNETSALGYPLTDESSTPDGVGRFNHFQHGSIYWHPNTGAHDVRGRIRERWAQLRWERGFLGFPTQDHQAATSGRTSVAFSQFQGGRIEWDLTTDHVQTLRIPSQASPTYIVPVVAVQARDSLGGSRPALITPAEIQQWLVRVNEVFATTGISFVYNNQLLVLDNTDVNNLMGTDDPQWIRARDLLNQMAAQQRALLVVFRYGPGPSPTGRGFSWWDYDFVIMPGFSVTTVCGVQNLGLLAHEFGHYFGLPHTFGPIFQSEQDATDYYLSNFQNPNIFDGDRWLLGDTLPDPFIQSFQCDTARNSIVLAGTPFALARSNAMSYWHSPFAQTFSYDQINRIRQVLVDRMTRGVLNATEVTHPVRIQVIPYPIPLNRVVRLQVTAVDIQSGSAVAGQVKIDGVVAANTNTLFTHKFHLKRVRIPGTKPAEYDYVEPTGTVSFASYPDAPIDFGF